MWFAGHAVSSTFLIGQRKLDWELVGLGGLLLALLAAGAWTVTWVRNWRKDDDQSTVSPEGQVEQYRLMLEEGLLEPEEFDRLRRRLLGPRQYPAEEPRQGEESYRSSEP